jgi:hypothetical protein
MVVEKSGQPQLVYWDTNVFGDLVDTANADASEWLKIIRTAISEEHIHIVPSFETLQEILIVPEDKSGLWNRRQQLYRDVVDWMHLLKPADELFHDDIVAFARTGNPGFPFVRPDHPLWACIDQIRFGKIHFSSPSGGNDYLSQTGDFNRRFVSKVLMRADPQRAKLVRDNIRTTRSTSEMQWKRLWNCGGTATIMARDFADHLNVLTECQHRGLDQLLLVPTVRMTFGFILHSWYMQIVQRKTNFAMSDAMDSRQATCAGAVGNMVTTDKKLIACIKHIPDHNIRLWSISEFVSYCCERVHGASPKDSI